MPPPSPPPPSYLAFNSSYNHLDDRCWYKPEGYTSVVNSTYPRHQYGPLHGHKSYTRNLSTSRPPIVHLGQSRTRLLAAMPNAKILRTDPYQDTYMPCTRAHHLPLKQNRPHKAAHFHTDQHPARDHLPHSDPLIQRKAIHKTQKRNEETPENTISVSKRQKPSRKPRQPNFIRPVLYVNGTDTSRSWYHPQRDECIGNHSLGGTSKLKDQRRGAEEHGLRKLAAVRTASSRGTGRRDCDVCNTSISSRFNRAIQRIRLLFRR